MSTKLPVSFTVRAERQAQEANAWWRENRAAVPNAFSEELERVVELVALQPAVGARAVNVRLAGVRRVLMHRVQHYLYYRVIEAPHRSLQVVAVWHTSRGTTPPP